MKWQPIATAPVDTPVLVWAPSSRNGVCGAFEVIAVCLKHDFSISHEDDYGSFVIEKFEASNVAWLQAASLNLSKEVA